MFRSGYFGVLLFLAVPAQAKDIVLTLPDVEQKALYQVCDAATKARGMEAAPFCAYLWQKVEAAGQAVPPAPKAEEPAK